MTCGQEPIDVLRKWLEGHEKAGRFEIYDQQLKSDFWLYYNQNWAGGRHAVASDVELCTRPRLLMEPPPSERFLGD